MQTADHGFALQSWLAAADGSDVKRAKLSNFSLTALLGVFAQTCRRPDQSALGPKAAKFRAVIAGVGRRKHTSKQR